jgi:hypothetical protein
MRAVTRGAAEAAVGGSQQNMLGGGGKNGRSDRAMFGNR